MDGTDGGRAGCCCCATMANNILRVPAFLSMAQQLGERSPAPQKTGAFAEEVP